MKKVYGSDDPLLVARLRQVLESEHVACVVRNDFLLGAAGELPPNECWPELWVLHDEQADKARALVEAFVAAADPAADPWTCAGCGEVLDGAFTQCWQCGRERSPWEIPGPDDS